MGDYNCSCRFGTHGKRCEMNVDDCKGNKQCQHGGHCVDEIGNFSCFCEVGWHGRLCDKDRDECSEDVEVCSGTCVNTPGSYHCACEKGFRGVVCDEDVNECENETNPCAGNYACKNTYGSYQCYCPPGFNGSRCNIDVDECLDKDICKNNGTCNNTRGSFFCLCSKYFQGIRCEESVNECLSPQICSGRGDCYDETYGFRCVCEIGYAGETCAFHEAYCNERPCENNGNCSGGRGTYSSHYCQCLAGFTGPYCEEDVNECLSTSLCLHDSTCINTWGSYVCKCRPTVMGKNCEFYKPCGEFPCQNGGTCIAQKSFVFQCLCTRKFTGPQCQIPIPENCNYNEMTKGCKTTNSSDLVSHKLRLNALSATDFIYEYDERSVKSQMILC